jgi:hypothetical protein
VARAGERPGERFVEAEHPRSAATKRYPDPSVAAATPTIGCTRWRLPVLPRNTAWKEKMPPSDATSQ